MAPTRSLFKVVTLAACSLVCVWPTAAPAQEAATKAPAPPSQYRKAKDSDGMLRWQFQKGQNYSSVTEQATVITVNIPGQPGKTEQKITTEQSLQVLDVNAEGTAKTSSTIERMVMAIDVAGQAMKFDTSSEEEPTGPLAEAAKLIKQMIGKAILQDMAPSGQISNVEVPDAMIYSGDNPLASALMNKKSLEEMTTRSSLEFPSDKPDVGTTWQKVAELDMGPVKVLTTTDYTYLGVKEGQHGPSHVIEGKISQTFPGAPGIELKVVQENSKVLFYFDGIKGFLRSSELNQDLTMEISAQGQKFEQRIQNSTTFNFEEKG